MTKSLLRSKTLVLKLLKNLVTGKEMMKMSNSPLVTYTKISPNRTSPRNHTIDRITIHCVVGQCTVESLGNIFAPVSRQASSNYGIGYDGRIGMYCEEKDRSWCSSSGSNDHRAVTIETASDNTYPYAVTDKAYNSLIDLVTDICKRNNKTKILWFGDKNKTLSYEPASNEMVMTVHRWFANKSCPGDYLYNLHGDIANKVNERLNAINKPTPVPFKVGDAVKIVGEKYNPTSSIVPAWVKQNYTHIITQTTYQGKKVYKGGKECVLLGKKIKNGDTKELSGINTWVAVDGLALASSSTPAYRTYTVVSNDTLSKIATKFLGKWSRYTEIKSLNGLTSDIIYIGQVLKIPNK